MKTTENNDYDFDVQPSSDKVIEAFRRALEMTTPEHAGLPWDHPDHKKNQTKKPEYW